MPDCDKSQRKQSKEKRECRGRKSNLWRGLSELGLIDKVLHEQTKGKRTGVCEGIGGKCLAFSRNNCKLEQHVVGL